MPKLNAYLSFDGTCAEAMKFYASVLGAKVEALITFGQAPGDARAHASHADKIMHAYLVHPEFELMAGDMPPGMPYGGIKGIMLTLSHATAAEGRKVFDALADGGQVTMPPTETFWADFFGMVTDRYGVPWAVNGGLRPTPKM
jgi:PhnB protein